MQGRQCQTVPESPRPIHGPWHGLLVSILIGLICTKVITMWNRLWESRVPMTCMLTGANGARGSQVEVTPIKDWWAPFYCCFCDYRMLAYIIASCEVCINWRKPIGACKIQCQSPSRRLIELRWSHQKIKLDCFTVQGGTVSPCI